MMVISMWCGHSAKIFPSINRFHCRSIHYINYIFIDRICKYFHVIPGSGNVNSVFIDLFPFFPCIIRTIHSRLISLGFNYSKYPFRICTRNRNTRFTKLFRKSFFHFFPGISSIDRFIQSRTFTSRFHRPCITLVLPHRSIQDQWIFHIHRQRRCSGLIINKQYFFPGRSPIFTSINTSFFCWTILCPLNRNKYNVGVCGMNDHIRNMS